MGNAEAAKAGGSIGCKTMERKKWEMRTGEGNGVEIGGVRADD
jgi:hypothetical protein